MRSAKEIFQDKVAASKRGDSVKAEQYFQEWNRLPVEEKVRNEAMDYFQKEALKEYSEKAKTTPNILPYEVCSLFGSMKYHMNDPDYYHPIVFPRYMLLKLKYGFLPPYDVMYQEIKEFYQENSIY